ncbi:hypothetical protein [Paraliomyxa miuraensis]|uniref:hypothetical protein n=1 Tax=Paraliomyxa miuraensis TaxID=376150 RepID=UPI002255309C|nr:hypothetical protein [Paraliomyxa miuraensis]MCX4247737.1 hypothetical protein [Paraliomyxa miuraensis]
MPWSRSLAPLVFAFATLAVAPGCDREAETKPDAKADAGTETKDPDAASAQTCAVRGQEMERELLDACTISEQLLSVDVPFTPWKSAPSSAPSNALRLELSPKGVVVGWGSPLPLGELEARLIAEREHAAMASRSRGPLSWVLAIDGTTARKDVASALQVLASTGLSQGWVQLGTTSVGNVPKPRDPKLLAELTARVEAKDPSERAAALADEISRAMPPCPGAAKAFEAVAVAAPEQRCELLARGMAAGLVGCGCPKVDTMATLLYALSVGAEVPTRLGVAVPVTVDPKAKPQPGATWADVVAGASEGTFTALWVSPR